MAQIGELIDKVGGLGTWLTLASVVVATIAYLNGDVNAFQALVAAGAGGAGSGLIGHARNGAGRGVKK